MDRKIITVEGEISAQDMGLTLPHEHIMVDFEPLDKRAEGMQKYTADEVTEVMLPYLTEIRGKGVRTFIDCSPMYLARDVHVLKRLSELSGINIITNTGLYKQPFIPRYAFDADAYFLADKWIKEFYEGIDGTDIRPGFIKTAVFAEPLESTQQKIIKAAAVTSKETGLIIATHTESGNAAMNVLRILSENNISPNKWIYIHAQVEPDIKKLITVAKEGAWIELDGISPYTLEMHLDKLIALLDKGFENQILLSQDSGWYNVGEERGGKINPYSYIFDLFIPKALERGIPKRTLDSIMAVNPARAFSI